VAIAHLAGTVFRIDGVLDPDGRNPKDRPVVLVTDFHDDHIFGLGVCITGEFSLPLPNHWIKLAFSSGHCTTGLTKPSVAKCEWKIEFCKEDILEVIGAVSSVELKNILENLYP